MPLDIEHIAKMASTARSVADRKMAEKAQNALIGDGSSNPDCPVKCHRCELRCAVVIASATSLEAELIERADELIGMLSYGGTHYAAMAGTC